MGSVIKLLGLNRQSRKETPIPFLDEFEYSIRLRIPEQQVFVLVKGLLRAAHKGAANDRLRKIFGNDRISEINYLYEKSKGFTITKTHVYEGTSREIITYSGGGKRHKKHQPVVTFEEHLGEGAVTVAIADIVVTEWDTKTVLEERVAQSYGPWGHLDAADWESYVC